MKLVHDIARTHLKSMQKRNKYQYNLKLLERTYAVGDKVYVFDQTKIKGKNKKLNAPWKGPGVVTEVLAPYAFRVRLRIKVFVIHHDKLKLCRDRDLPNWITNLDLANSDSDGDDEDDGLYCTCRKPWEGRFMIECDLCGEWYHGACVNITPAETIDIDRFKCTKCAE
ncbi:uncharacterized protein [Antedon mediterranea]|uniref:uncharacterized protein n=1 Tax=Antedon mediterranea TaxID=105859 RepID=UPI003AF46623